MAEQNARIEDGSGNIIVQAVDSTVTVGASATLCLVPWHLRPQPRPVGSDIALLNPFTLSVPFVGRAAELARLDDWLRAPAPISARCLTGRAGSGKTRLALELCAKAEALDGSRWDAGFLLHAELQRFFAKENIGTWGWRRPTLIVLDYAAGCAQALKPWLEELSQNAGHPQRPMRLLLLERFADDGAGWWAELTRTGWSNAGIPALFDPSAPEPLAELAAEDRGALVAGFLEQAGSTADAERIKAQAERADATGALDLLMAGLTAARGIAGGNPGGGRTGMAVALAGHERNRLDAIARDRTLDAGLLAHLAAMLTLQGGAVVDAALDMAAAEVEALRSRADPQALYSALCDAYAPGADERLPPILPDLIGEAFVLDTFKRLSSPQQAQAVIRACARNEAATTAAVIRTAQDFAEEQTHPALRWLDVLIENAADPPALMRLDDAFPQQTLVLRERAASVTAAIAESQRNVPISAQRARLLNNLCVRLSDLGRREEALAAIEEAVGVYRDLALARPDGLQPDLAQSLNNLSVQLSALGRREEALSAIEEAVAIRRDLALERPATFPPALAESLNNLSVQLSALGRREEALSAVEEAVAIRRDLALARPDAFQPDLAQSLNNLSVRLSALGRREEALSAIEEAVAIRRYLALARPDAFQPALASSLNNLSERLSALGRREEALSAIEEAVGVYRDLALARPDAFQPALASSLNSLSERLSALGRREEALSVIEEAVAIRRDLALARPDAFRPELASSLNNLSNRLSDLGRGEEALSAIEEAIAIRRDLALACPDAFQPDLAESLNNLSVQLSAQDRREEALAAIEGAAQIYRDLALARPDAFRPDLALALNNLSGHLSALGRGEEALSAIVEAVAIRRDLALARPVAFRPDLALALNNLSAHLSALGRREEALAAIEEAVAIRRELALARPEAFRADLARSLSVLGHCLDAVDRLETALQVDHESVALLTVDFVRLSQVHAGLMGAICQGYLRRCMKAGVEPDEALLAPVIAVFERMQASEAGDQAAAED